MKINSDELRNLLQNPNNQAIQTLADNLAVNYGLQDDKKNIQAYLLLLCAEAEKGNFDPTKILEGESIELFLCYAKKTDPRYAKETDPRKFIKLQLLSTASTDPIKFIELQLLSTASQEASSGGDGSDSEEEGAYVLFGVLTDSELRMPNVDETYSDQDISRLIRDINKRYLIPLADHPDVKTLIESRRDQGALLATSKLIKTLIESRRDQGALLATSKPISFLYRVIDYQEIASEVMKFIK